MEQVISLYLQLKELENLRLNSSARVRLLMSRYRDGPLVRMQVGDCWWSKQSAEEDLGRR